MQLDHQDQLDKEETLDLQEQMEIQVQTVYLELREIQEEQEIQGGMVLLVVQACLVDKVTEAMPDKQSQDHLAQREQLEKKV